MPFRLPDCSTSAAMGGELYRSLLVAPWTDWQDYVWEVEPAVYDVEHGFGFNHGNTILVAERRGV
jgi:hypothetical protein